MPALLLGASLLPTSTSLAQPTATSSEAVVFTHTTVVTNDADKRTHKDVALAVQNGIIGDTDEILARFPQAEIYDGRRKALLPGLINCDY